MFITKEPDYETKSRKGSMFCLMRIILYILILFFVECGTTEKKNNSSTNSTINQSDVDTVKSTSAFSNIEEIINESNPVSHWISSDYYPTLFFGPNDTMFMQFSGQCGYHFPVKIHENKIVVIFDTLEDCIYRCGIKDKFDIKKNPEKGKPFMTLSWQNDTILNAEFLFPEWIDSVNAINKSLPCFVKTYRFISGR